LKKLLLATMLGLLTSVASADSVTDRLKEEGVSFIYFPDQKDLTLFFNTSDKPTIVRDLVEACSMLGVNKIKAYTTMADVSSEETVRCQ